MMMSQIFQFVDVTTTEKSKYLENKTFFLQIRKSLITHQGAYFISKNTFVAEVTFNSISEKKTTEYFPA